MIDISVPITATASVNRPVGIRTEQPECKVAEVTVRQHMRERKRESG